MNTIHSIGLSGMAAAQARLTGAAHNLANAATPGFHRQRIDAQAQPEGGVAVQVGREPVAGADMASDLVAQRRAVYEFSASLRTVQTADRMMGALLDVLA